MLTINFISKNLVKFVITMWPTARHRNDISSKKSSFAHKCNVSELGPANSLHTLV